jgi:hypothetical protein
MPQIIETVRIGMDADSLWSEIGKFGAVADWHPLIDRTEVSGEGDGAIRTAHGTNGNAQVERLTEHNDTRHLYRYTMQQTALAVRDYTAELRVEAAGADVSEVIWSARFELTEDGDGKTIEAVRHFLHAGTENLQAKFRATG